MADICTEQKSQLGEQYRKYCSNA